MNEPLIRAVLNLISCFDDLGGADSLEDYVKSMERIKAQVDKNIESAKRLIAEGES